VTDFDQACEKVAGNIIPTPAEFLAIVRGLGWRVKVGGDRSAALAAPSTDPLARKLARMLSREPYRTNVLAVIGDGGPWAAEPPPAEPRPDTIATPAGPEPDPGPPPPEGPPAGEPSPLAGTADRWGNQILRRGTARPATATRLLASEDGTCALRYHPVGPADVLPWEEVQDPDRRYPPGFLVRLPGATAHLIGSAFRAIFPASTRAG
jgi:hypothetical protein